jgi:hypothetical protein
MNPTITIDLTAFQKAIADRAERTRKPIADVLRQQARLFVLDAVKMTPPMRDGARPVQESFNEQREQGKKAVANDLGKAFATAEGVNVSKAQSRFFSESALLFPFEFKSVEIAGRIAALAARGDLTAIRKIVQQTGLPVLGVAASPSSQMHRNLRGSRGRVRSRRPFLITSTSALKRFAIETMNRVGKAKAGWAASARITRLSLPAWITKHATRGIAVDDLSNRNLPSITVGNDVDYIQSTGQRLRIIERAIKNRVRNMREQLDKAVRSGWKA